MSISHRVLGLPRTDNALALWVSTGQAVHRLLFDCGEGCLLNLEFSDVLENDHLFFSHFHMDHVSGFDSYLRATFDRERPVSIWGPPGTADIIWHRLHGFTWDLQSALGASWFMDEISTDTVRTSEFRQLNAAQPCSTQSVQNPTGLILETPDYSVQAIVLNHGTPSIGYIVREQPRSNVNLERVAALGLGPGAWLKRVKDTNDSGAIEIAGKSFDLTELRADLLDFTSGDSIAYITDFLLDETTMNTLETALQGVRLIVCEAQYRHIDLEFAQRNNHLTSVQAATLATRAGVRELELFHLSRRYLPDEHKALLEDARAVFPGARFPAHWEL
jgi:ribonuclease Z